MSTNFIVSTPKSHIQSLAYQGIQVCDSFHQIRDIVRTRLGDEYALLFAEPSPRQDGSAIDWYSPVQGAVQPLRDLPEEMQNTLRASIARMAQDIRRVAEDIKKVGAPAQVIRGTIVELALQYPDDSCLYVIGGQPVFTCWGFGPGSPGVAPQDLARLGHVPLAKTPTAAAAPPPVAEPEPEVPPLVPTAASGFSLRFLWWLLPLLLLLLLFLLLTGSFGGSRPLVSIPSVHWSFPSLPFLAAADTTLDKQWETLRAEEDKLLGQVRDWDAALSSLAEQCVPSDPPPAPLLPDRPDKADKGPSLIIPQKSTDVAFLEGRWLCDRGLVNKSDKQPITVLYDFGPDGQGQVIIRQRGRQDCVGKAKAHLQADNVLRIDVDKQLCPDGRAYAPETIECRADATGKATCRGTNATGQDWGGSAPFYKLQ